MGALTLADERRAPPPTVAAPHAQSPLEQERERHVAWRTPHPPSFHVVHANHGDEEEMNCYQLNSPTWRAKNVVVLHSTAGWRKAPA